ncbi:MAG: T9SS type A sorting domain-containing protein [Bacteroidota bacterium]
MRFLLATALLFSTALPAQITITAARFLDDLGQTHREVLYETNIGIDAQLQVIIAARGADQTWDFSDLNYIDSTVQEVTISEVATDDPFLADTNFMGTTHVWQEKIHPRPDDFLQDTSFSFRYGKFTDAAWTVRAGYLLADASGNGMLDTVVQRFRPSTLQIAFPITEGSFWSDSTRLTQTFAGTPVAGPITLDSTWVTGWGTLITPAGTEPALRLYTKTITRIAGLPTSEVEEQLDFVTCDGRIGASIVLEDGRAFHTVTDIAPKDPTSARDPALSSVRLEKIVPQPVKEAAIIHFRTERPGQVQLRLFDLAGRPVATLQEQWHAAGEHTLTWQRSDQLANGAYVLEIRMPGGRQTQKMVLH